jgi:uncharacterized protein YcbK (DUF882 family)
MPDDVDSQEVLRPSRRRFLQRAVGCTGLLLAPFAARAAVARRVSLVHTHTGESLALEYFGHSAYRPASLAQVNHFLRDFRSGEVHPIDPRLLDILHDLQALAGRGGTYEVISGYRSPRTNAALRRASTGVATRSLHLQGRAIDVRLKGFPTRKLRELALSLRSGGVGYYARADFLHLDTGSFRTWAA